MSYTIETNNSLTTYNNCHPIVKENGSLLLVTDEKEVLAVYSYKNYKKCYLSDNKGNPLKVEHEN